MFPVPDGKYVEYLYYSSTGCEKEAKVKVVCRGNKERRDVWKARRERSGGMK